MGKIRSREKRRKAKQITELAGKEKFQGKGFEDVKLMLKDMCLFVSKNERNIVASEIMKHCKEKVK